MTINWTYGKIEVDKKRGTKMKTKLGIEKRKERAILWQNNPLREKMNRPRKRKKTSRITDFSVAFNFKFKKGMIPIELVKVLEWSPLQGKKLTEKRMTTPTRRNDEDGRTKYMTQDEVVEILSRDYDINISRQSYTYLEGGGSELSSVKPPVILALCEILKMPLEYLYVD